MLFRKAKIDLNKRALVIIDVQKDLLPGGTVPVPEGDRVIPVINRAQEKFDLIYATRNWYPAHHDKFASSHPGREAGDSIILKGTEQQLWVDHCIQDSTGADFPERMKSEKVKKVFYKGTHPHTDSFSAFFDAGRKQPTGLGKILKKKNIGTVFLAGLATEFSIRNSALDAIELGLRTYVIENGCRGYDLYPGIVDRAVEEMETAGVKFIRGVDIPG